MAKGETLNGGNENDVLAGQEGADLINGGYGDDRLEAACRRALRLGARSYRSVKSILERSLDRVPLPDEAPNERIPLDHENLRGPDYYH